jgi:hypothetical protein
MSINIFLADGNTRRPVMMTAGGKRVTIRPDYKQTGGIIIRLAGKPS